MLTLKELIYSCLQKDQSAWGEFVLRFKPVAEKAVRARFSRHNFPYTIEDAKDLVQSIFLDIWEHNKLELVRDEDKITGWLAIVSQNSAIDFMRSSKRRLRQQPLFQDDQGNSLDLEEIVACESTPFEELAKTELGEALDILIGGLEPRDRLIIKLDLLHSLPHKEIAGMLKIPINTISTIIRRTRLKLKEGLKKKGFKDF